MSETWLAHAKGDVLNVQGRKRGKRLLKVGRTNYAERKQNASFWLLQCDSITLL